MKRKPNILFFPVRDPELKPEEWVKRINNNLFPIDDWNVYVVVRKPHLLEGYKSNIHAIDMYADRSYKKKITEKEIEEVENWLGYSFNSIIYMEDLKSHLRFKPTKRKKENITRHIYFFRKILIQKKINFCCICFPNDIVNITLYYILKKLNIPHWNLIINHKGAGGNKDLFEIRSDAAPLFLNKLKYNKREIENVYNQQRKKLMQRKDILCAVIKDRSKRNYMFSLKTIRLKLYQLSRLFKNQSRFETSFNIKDHSIIYIKSFINALFNNYIFRAFIFSKVPKNKKFFYFPLHYIKDSQITFRESFKDQLNLIKTIARSLPTNVELVIKTHPHFVGADYSFLKFRKIEKIPNVRIVHYSENNTDLINKSTGVLVINSGAGYEAIILNKPVITFGNVFYAKKNVSIKVKKIDELPRILLEVKKDPNYGIDLAERKKFVYEYYKNSFPLKAKLFHSDVLYGEEDKKTIIKKYKQMEKYFLKKK